MNNKLSLKIDEAGRILIPLRIRNKYNIQENDNLILSATERGIELKVEDIREKYPKTIEKLEFINEQYGLEMILLDEEKILYTTDKYSFLKNDSCTKDVKFFFNEKNLISKTNIFLTKDFYLNELCYIININLNMYKKGILLFTCKKNEEQDLVFLVSDLIS